MRRYFYFIIALLGAIHSASAQTVTNQKIVAFTQDLGLSNGKIHDITQDSHGFVWIATQDGLTRYDGNKAKRYYANEQYPAYGISHNYVYAVASHSSYGVWVGTTAGLDKYNHETGTFSKFSFYNAEGKPYLKPVWQIEPFAQDVCVLRTDSKELYVYTPQNDSLVQIPYKSFTPKHIPTSIDSIASQAVVVGDKGGLLYIVHISGRITVIDTIAYPISSVKVLTKNRICVSDVYGGVYIYENNKQIASFTFPNARVSNSEKYISSIEQISDNILYVSTRGSGMYEISISEKRFSAVVYNNKLINLHVEKVYKDSFNTLWIAHSYGGVSIALQQYQTFDVLQLPAYVYEQKILSVLQKNNILYIGTDGNGLFIYNLQTQSLQHIDYKTKFQNFEFDNIVTSLSADDTHVWIATYNKGVFAYNMKTQTFDFVKELQQIPHTNISNVFCDSKKQVWIGSYEHGVYVFDIAAKKLVKHYSAKSDNPKEALSCNGVTCFFEDVQGSLWIGSYYGISKIHKKGVSRYIVHTHKGLTSNTITTFAQDSKGKVWIATKQGLCYYDALVDSIYSFKIDHELQRKSIQSLRVSGDTLWLFTENGMYSVNSKTRKIREYATSNLGEISREAFAQFNSTWFIGAEKGIVTINARTVQPIERLQSIQLSDVMLQGVSVFSPQTKARVEYSNNEYHIIIPSKEDNIAVYFSDFEYNMLESSDYKYILEGYMDEWAVLQDANFVNFTKLQGGDYVLRIQKRYADSPIDTELRVHIHIQKEFWEYWFFYVTIVLLGIGLVYVVYVIRLQSVVSMRNKLQEQVEQRMGEIQSKIERIQEQEEKIKQQDADFLVQQEIHTKLENDIAEQRQQYSQLILDKDEEIAESKKQTQAVTKLKDLVQKNFELLEQNTREMVFRIILPSEMFDYVSPAVETFTGYSQQDFYTDSMMFRKLIISEGKDDFKKFRKYMIEGKVPPVMEYKIITKSGKEKWVAQYSTIIRDAKQQPIALEAVLVDISEKKELEQRSSAAKKRTKKLTHLEQEIQEHTSVTTVKQAIHVFADLLKRDDISLDEKQAFLETNQESSVYALHMIENFIDISKIEAGKMHLNYSQCYVNTVLQELQDSFSESKQYIGKKHIQLNLNVPSLEENFSFYTDTFRFRQIMMNLLGNSIKFTSNGSVEFGYEIIENAKLENNIELVFFVKDTGEGIPSEKLDAIFNSNQQSDETIIVGGLGLAVTKKIVELLGGKMWAESEKGKGTTIKFSLPVEKMKGLKKAEQQVVEKIVETKDWSQKTLLLVEDEENNYDLVREVLAKTNISILWAQNGAEGVEMFKQYQRDIDIILMDIQMPVMNGYTATQEIKAIDKDIPVIAQTAYANYDSKLNCIKVGCENYIEKPYKRKDLIDLLSKYL